MMVSGNLTVCAIVQKLCIHYEGFFPHSIISDRHDDGASALTPIKCRWRPAAGAQHTKPERD